jgi:hypothetical protein
MSFHRCHSHGNANSDGRMVSRRNPQFDAKIPRVHRLRTINNDTLEVNRVPILPVTTIGSAPHGLWSMMS